jgi:hypothetical protein
MGDHIDNGIADADNVEIGLGHGLAMIAGSPKGVEYRPGSRSGKTPGSAAACRAESLIRQFEVVLCNAAPRRRKQPSYIMLMRRFTGGQFAITLPRST